MNKQINTETRSIHSDKDLNKIERLCKRKKIGFNEYKLIKTYTKKIKKVSKHVQMQEL